MTLPAHALAKPSGPFFPIGLIDPPSDRTSSVRGCPDRCGHLRSQVFDGAGEPVPDALIETWQPEGAGRCATDDRRALRHRHQQAGAGRRQRTARRTSMFPFFARGIAPRLVTRMYSPTSTRRTMRTRCCEPSLLTERATLMAVREEGGLRLTSTSKASGETVFFDR